MTTNALEPTMQFATLLLAPTWDENNYMHFFQLCSIPLIDKSTLYSLEMKFAP
jgi:hypothetical protein